MGTLKLVFEGTHNEANRKPLPTLLDSFTESLRRLGYQGRWVETWEPAQAAEADQTVAVLNFAPRPVPGLVPPPSDPPKPKRTVRRPAKPKK